MPISFPGPQRWSRLLRYLIPCIALLYVGLYLLVAARRIGYPYELEWMEGGSVDHLARIAAGLPLYAAPSIEFIPYIYPPLYFQLSSLVASITGVGFLPLRLVSLAATLGCFGMIFLIVRRETRSYYAAALGMGLFAATFVPSGAWFDIARVDSLFLLLMLVVVYLLRFRDSAAAWIGAGVVLALAYLTKQTALVIGAPLMLYALMVSWRRALLFIGTAVLLGVASFLILNAATDGWYAYYLYKLPSGHALLWRDLIFFWTRDLLPTLGVACLVALPGLYHDVITESERPRYFYALLLVGAVGASWMSRMHIGGYINVIMPAHAAIAILFGLSAHRIVGYLREREGARAPVGEMFLYAACLVQFAVLFYDPRTYIPTREDRAAGDRFVAALAAVPGEILVPQHSYLATLAGKRSNAHAQAMVDILRSSDRETASWLLSELEDAVARGRYSAVVLDNYSVYDATEPGENWLAERLRKRYTMKPLEYGGEEFYPTVGLKTRPQYIYTLIGTSSHR